MTQVTIATGITLDRDAHDEYLRFDLKQYGEKLIDFFRVEGIKISPYASDFVAKIKRSEQQIVLGQCQSIKTQDLWK
jgi:hypothetical protein